MFLAFRNGMRARLKGLNGIGWGMLTIVMFTIGFFIGSLITFFAIFRDTLDMNRMEKDKDAYTKELMPQIQDAFVNNPIHSLTIFMCGLGGYLLVRYILEKKKPLKQPEGNNGIQY